jgi:hypothetical protein
MEQARVERRLEDLEGWRMSAEVRLGEVVRRTERVEEELQRISTRMDLHREGQIATQTLVSVGNQKTDDLAAKLQAYVDLQERRRNEEAEREQARRDLQRNRAPQWWLLWATTFLALVGAGGFIQRLLEYVGSKP